MTNRAKIIIIFVIYLSLGFIIYGNVIDGKFLWDDDNNIVKNSYIKDRGHIRDFFSKDILAGSGQAIGWYRPILLISYTIDYSIWGLNPVGYHLFNIFLHIFSAMILFLIILRLFNKPSIAFLAGLLFLIHPVQTEAVSYISGRADLLLVFFLLLSLYLFLLLQEFESLNKRAIFYGLSIFFFGLALFSKEAAIIYPILLILFILTFGKKEGREPFRKVLLITWPFLTLSATYQILRASLNLSNSFAIVWTGIDQRLLMFLKTLPTYWKLIFIPSDLHYNFERKLVINSWDGTVVLSVLILVLIVLLLVYLKDYKKLFIFGFGWFFIGLVPVSGILVPINFIIGERWLYFSAIGIFIIISVLIDKIFHSIRKKRNQIILLIFLSLYSVFFIVSGIKRNFVWQNGVMLLKDTLKYAPRDPKLRNSLGLEYIKQKNDGAAFQEFKIASSIDPADALIHYNLGIFYVTHQMNQEAINEFEKMVNLNQNLKFGYSMLADINYQNKEYGEATKWLEKLSKLSPNSWEVYYKLGMMYNLIGDKNSATQALNQAVKLNPDLLNKLRK